MLLQVCDYPHERSTASCACTSGDWEYLDTKGIECGAVPSCLMLTSLQRQHCVLSLIMQAFDRTATAMLQPSVA